MVTLGGNSASIPAIGIGTAVIKSRNGRGTVIKLSKAYYVPDARYNLISVSQLTEKGASVYFGKYTAKVILGPHNPLMEARLVDRLWALDISHCRVQKPEQKEHGFFSATKRTESRLLWHCRLGHIGEAGLNKTVNLVTGINLEKGDKPLGICAGCVTRRTRSA